MFATTLPIQDPKNPPTLKFPARCVHCGQSPEEVLSISLPMGVEKRSKPVMLSLAIPMCAEGARLERNLTKVTLVPFLVGGLLVGLAAFVLTWLVVPQGETLQTRSIDLVIGAFVGLVAGILGGMIVELAFKLLFAPIYGKSLLRRPLTALEIFSDTETCIGLSAVLSKDKKQLKLTFESEQVGREFENLNS